MLATLPRDAGRAWLLAALVLAPAGAARATGGALTDQALTLSFPANHWSGGPDAHLTGVDAAGDPVFQMGLWYRVEGGTREHPMAVPDSETYDGATASAVWNDLGGTGFGVVLRTRLIDGEGPSGCVITSATVQNNANVARQFTLFFYLDADLAATASGDSAVLVNQRFIEAFDGTSRLAYRFHAGRFQVAPHPALRDLLNDALVTDLDFSGLPSGPGDLAVAAQDGPRPIPAGNSRSFGPVSACFNPPHRHVKGDLDGLGLASLLGQESDLSNRGVVWMRRTADLGMNAVISAPSAAASLVGADDFDADYDDEWVWRDLQTGVAYVDGDALSGAPTLALNWKLSATGDFDHDGRADILWRNTSSQKLVIWTMSGNAKLGNIIPSPDQAVDANWEVAGAADFNGDGQRDLLWYNQTSGKIVLWFMNAAVQRVTGQFTNPSTVGNNNWKVVAVGDYGRGPAGVYDTQDVVWQNDTSKKIVVWFMDLAGNRTNGTFTTPDTLFSDWDVVGPR